jgi:hypothetical protein
LAAIGAISLVINAAVTGEADAKSLLMGLVTGVAGGAAIGGLPGALALGATIPVVMMITARLKPDTKTLLQQAVDRMTSEVRGEVKWTAPSAEWKATAERINREFTQKIASMGLTQAFMQASRPAFLAVAQAAYAAGTLTAANFLQGMRDAGFSAEAIAAQADQIYREAPGAPMREHLDQVKHGVEQEGKMGDQAVADAKAAANARTAAHKSALAEYRKALDAYQKAQNASNKKSVSDAKSTANQIGDAMKAAAEQATQEMNQAASNLMQIFKQMRDENQQIFGELFQGEWLTGPAADVAEEWGIKPAMKDLQKDLNMQLTRFREFNQTIAQLAARGAPAELIEQARAAGPENLDTIKVLAQSSPKEFQKYVGTWKTAQNAIDKQTKLQFNARLKEWRSHGQAIMTEIVMGLRDEDVRLENYFRNLVTKLVPDYVSDAVAAAAAEAAAGITAAAGEELTPKEKAVAAAKARLKRARERAAATQPTTVNNNTNITVNGAPGEDPRDTARRTVHLYKNGARAQSVEWGIRLGTGRGPAER